MPRNTSGLKRGGSPGRPKGRLDDKTLEIKAYAREFLASPAYVKSVEERILEGKAPHMELFLAQHAYGKPKDVVEVKAEGAGVLLYLPENRRELKP